MRDARTDERLVAAISDLARRYADDVDQSRQTRAEEFRALAECDGIDLSDAHTRRVVELVLRTLGGREADVAQSRGMRAWDLLLSH